MVRIRGFEGRASPSQGFGAERKRSLWAHRGDLLRALLYHGNLNSPRHIDFVWEILRNCFYAKSSEFDPARFNVNLIPTGRRRSRGSAGRPSTRRCESPDPGPRDGHWIYPRRAMELVPDPAHAWPFLAWCCDRTAGQVAGLGQDRPRPARSDAGLPDRKDPLSRCFRRGCHHCRGQACRPRGSSADTSASAQLPIWLQDRRGLQDQF